MDLLEGFAFLPQLSCTYLFICIEKEHRIRIPIQPFVNRYFCRMKFIDREKEAKLLEQHFGSEPNSILFVYGPKSSGKSTLLRYVVDQLDNKKFPINYLNLRGVLIHNFQTFLDVFFSKNIKQQTADLISGSSVNIGFFKVNVGEESLLKQNPFKVMEQKLLSAKNRGLQPIIILDEIQLLNNIAINGKRYLLDELFNLFVRLTKETHAAHIVCATSDSFFIEEIYDHAKLAKTSKFLLLDHFDKDTVENWLSDEGFNEEKIKLCWDFFGGCPWQLQELIKGCKNGDDIIKICDQFVQEDFGKLDEFIFDFNEDETKIFWEITRQIVDKGYCDKYDIDDRKTFRKIVKLMVARDHWFYRSDQGKVLPNSRSIFKAMVLLQANR